jgi:hypothetical protein
LFLNDLQVMFLPGAGPQRAPGGSTRVVPTPMKRRE